jgi:protein-S-isoprenylcysteine O-methyltransferase Ste14
MKRFLANVFGLALTWGIWLWLIGHPLAPLPSLVVAITGTLALIPLVFVGRWLLDEQPTVERAEWVTTGVHYLVAIGFGSAILEAIRFGLNTSISLTELLPAWLAPILPVAGLGLMVLSGLLWILVIINLAIKGLGLPLAAAMTRVVVTDWLYAWTRNPMILSTLALLVGLGLWLRSGLFLVWVLVVVSPAVLVFIKVYEERELEIRFGQTYLDYKAATPLLFPRHPH